MRLLARIMAGLFGLLAIGVVAGAWALPRVVDWQLYRGEIERLATETLGREVRLSGDFEFRLLPEPELAVRGLSMADPGDGFAMAAPELRLSVGLWPLVVGRVQVNELVIAGADIRLRPAGHVLDANGVAPPRWLRRARLRLADARIHIGALTAERVSARVMAGDLRGPWNAEGSAVIADRAVRFTAALGQLGRDGTATIDLVLAQGQGSFTLGGIVNLATGSILGRAVVATNDLSTHLPAPKAPLRAEGRVSGGPDAVAIDDIAGELAGTPMTGALSLRLAPELRIDLAAAANTIALDGWVDALGSATGSLRGPPVAIDLSAEGATFRQGSIRRPRISIVLADGQIAVNEAEALLPGGTRVAGSGVVTATPQGPRFEGLGELNGPNLRATLDWLGVPTEGVPALSLRSASLLGRIAADRAQVELTELDGRIDDTRLAGGIVLRPGPRPAFGAGLRLDRLRLDDLIGEEPPDWLRLARLLGQLNANLRLEFDTVEVEGVAIANLGLDATLDRGQVTVRRLGFESAAGVRLEARGGAVLHGFGAPSAPGPAGPGASGAGGAGAGPAGGGPGAAATGAASPGAAAPGPASSGVGGPATGERVTLTETVIEASTGDGAVALAAFGGAALLPAEAAAGPGSVRATLSGPLDALLVDLAFEAGGGRLEARGGVSVPSSRYEGTLAIHHPSAVRALRTAGLGDHLDWLGEGSLAAIGRVVLRPGVLESESGLRVVLGALRARLAGRIQRTDAWEPRLVVTAERLPLPEALPEPARISALLERVRGQVALHAAEVMRADAVWLTELDTALAMGADAIAVERLTASLWSGRLTARGRFVPAASSQPPRIELAGMLARADLTRAMTGSAVDLSAGRVELLRFDLQTAGNGLDGLAASLSGSGALVAEDGVLLGFDLRAAAAALAGQSAPIPAVVAALSGGGTAFERLAGEFRIGAGLVEIVAGELVAGSAQAALGGAIGLPGRSLDLAVTATLNTGVPPVAVRITGPAVAPRSVVETAALERWLREGRP